MKKLLVGSECLLIVKSLLLGQNFLVCLSKQLLATTSGVFAVTPIVSKLKLRAAVPMLKVWHNVCVCEESQTGQYKVACKGVAQRA